MVGHKILALGMWVRTLPPKPNMAKNETKFFRDLYVPPLERAGDKRARNIARTAKASAGQRALRLAGRVFGNTFTKENAAEAGRRGGTKRWAKLDPEERRKQILASAARMRAAKMALPKSQRAAISSRIGKMAWANLSPEERARRLALAQLNLQAGLGKRMAKWTAQWPFPHGPGRLTPQQLREAKERKARRRSGLRD